MPPTTTTTGHDVLELGYQRLRDISPSHIATEGPELLLIVQQALDGLFGFAARINPAFFAKVETVSFEDPIGWLRPADAESVFRIELADGTEVVIVPYNQRGIEPGAPTVYSLGQYYRSTMLDLAPVGGDLLIYYAKRPERLETLEDTLDPLWPEAYNELLGLEIAIYLAAKADLQNAIQHLRVGRDMWASRFAAFLQHETAGIRRAWAGSLRPLPAAMTLLAGGGD